LEDFMKSFSFCDGVWTEMKTGGEYVTAQDAAELEDLGIQAQLDLAAKDTAIVELGNSLAATEARLLTFAAERDAAIVGCVEAQQTARTLAKFVAEVNHRYDFSKEEIDARIRALSYPVGPASSGLPQYMLESMFQVDSEGKKP
jgi:hypothetical protein